MDKHALAILEAAKSWSRPETSTIQQSGEISMRSKSAAVTPQFLVGLISESIRLGGTLLDQFWIIVGQCHTMLGENVDKLRLVDFYSVDQSVLVLFEGLDRDHINFDPIFQLAAELFTHLGVAFMSPRVRKSASGTPHSVSDVVSLETDELLKHAKESGFENRKQTVLKELVRTKLLTILRC